MARIATMTPAAVLKLGCLPIPADVEVLSQEASMYSVATDAAGRVVEGCIYADTETGDTLRYNRHATSKADRFIREVRPAPITIRPMHAPVEADEPICAGA